jgi:hypothetical protein
MILLAFLTTFPSLPLSSHAESGNRQITEQPLPAFSLRHRWSEDWSVVNTPDRAVETTWLPYKYIPLNDGGTNFVSLGGEYRLAYESYDRADRGISEIGYQNALQNRLALHADWQLGQQWRLYGQLGVASVNDREGGATAVDESDVNVWQLFIDYHMPVNEDERFVFRLGRQFIETANVFITAGEANNVRLVYDGGRVAWVTESSAPFEAFVAEYVDYADAAFAMSGTGEYFWGLRYSEPVHKVDTNLSFLYMGWDLKDRQFEQGEDSRYDETRHMLMLWFNKPLSGIDQVGLDYYLVYQFGKFEDQPGGSDIQAFAAFGEAEYAFLKGSTTPIIGLKTSYFSGDSDPEDNRLNTFYNPVFGTPYFSYARDVMPFNLIHIQPNVGYRFNDNLLVTLSNDVLWRASTNDAFYTGTNSIGVNGDASDSRYIGTQAQLSAKWQPNRYITLSLYGVYFWAGDMVTDGGGEDQIYFHLGVNFLF